MKIQKDLVIEAGGPLDFPRKRSFVSRLGFTLIEVLVVMAIVMLLVSLLVPSLARVRGASRRVGCGAQMRQVSMMMIAYAADNRGGIFSSAFSEAPDWFEHDPSNPQSRTWQYRGAYWWNAQLTGGYRRGNEYRHLLRCPYAPPYETESAWAIGNWQWWTYGCRASRTTGRNILEIRFGAVPDPSTYWILSDSGGGRSENWPEGSQTFRLIMPDMLNSGFNYSGSTGFSLRHDGQANVSFADGHVAPHGRESLISWGIRGHVDQYGNRIVH